MMPPVLFPVAPVLIPVCRSNSHFQVRRIYCVGRNYAAHAREMGGDPTREPPFFFQKPTDAIQVVLPGTILEHAYPPMTANYHHEVELVAAIGKGGRNIAAGTALDHVVGYAVGLDMTRRDLQRAMAEQKKPWEVGKSFDHGAIIGQLHLASDIGHVALGAITLTVNGQSRQSSDLAHMTWSVAEQVANLSQYYELFPGDIIYAGTPENVGPVVLGDLIVATIAGLDEIHVRIVA
ncbi:MAG: fumarylacetoacetate hydrolase family protein [Rhodocyclaceae bacterium]|nr:fumarylacetoacetate hydrolase family protein [Rhodocyclaceae bacterium]MBK6678224.1 fumarylacetoacetate hydrolase family protein [Rhodocyclaceae bacterium]MBK7813542.1 fumarylacetoacetate hydrolase family protein [Rhodocyclaceae bacterium]MBK9310884.1 fumarylacetoacetate hydrolase family protein [Rhodocyclaceae bacterium]MBK9954047.1 fumarylacetoacetate hydrolase family protein [Rhodocyclaceae bacterium]